MKKAILLLICLGFLLVAAGMIYGDIPPQERAALIALYNSTNGGSWTNNTNWNGSPGTENTWYGVTCDAGNTTVLRLVLSSNNLVGTIPAELGNLTNLTWLYLDGNNLSGSIPPQLGNLTSIDRFLLGYNQLSGTIPPELGNLVNASTLSVMRNQLTGSIPATLGNLANVRNLLLTSNQLSGNIPPQFGNLANITTLSLGANQLTGPIPSELGNLSNLRYLYLAGNYLSGSIPPQLGNITTLERIWCSNNWLSGTIPPELGNLPNLAQLYLAENWLSGSIPPELGNLSASLEYLVIYGNRLRGSIPSSLADLVNLRDNGCDFRWNALYTSDSSLRDFLNTKQIDGDWESTQTIAPEDVQVGSVDYDSVEVSWTPIVYTGNNGGYQVFYRAASAGIYTLFAITADKTVSQMEVTGLNQGTTYFFVVRTRTDPHFENPNTVDSEYSVEVSAVTLSDDISGYVLTPGGQGVSGVTLTFSNGVDPVTTDASGYYSQTVPHEWTGTVTPSREGYTFEPASRSYTNVSQDLTDENYTAHEITLEISGRVRDSSGTGIANVTLSFSNNGGTTVTNANGNYSHTVSYGWTGTVTPARTGFTFEPARRNYSNVTSHQADQDYTAAAITPEISGRVRDSSGTGIANVTLSFSNNGGSTVTNANGNYFHTVSYGWTGTVTPARTGFTFEPGQRNYSDVTSDRADQNYTAAAITPVISGRITNGNNGMANVTLTFSNNGGTTVTNANGNYSHGVAYGWTGTATPARSGFTFAPVRRSYNNVTSDQAGQDYTAAAIIPVISGRVADDSGTGIADVTLSFSNNGGSAVTDSNGNYSRAVPYGWSGIVTPAKGGYTFVPTSRTYANVTVNHSGQDYTAAVVTPVISGHITDSSDTGISVVTLTFSNNGGTTVTNSNGYYSHTVSYNWTGTVTPEKEGFSFEPVQRDYTQVIADRSGQNYTAKALTPVISGRVTDASGTGIFEVLLTFSGENSSVTTVTTDANGHYVQAVPHGWTGTVNPAKTGFTLEPANRTYTNVTADQTGQDYIATAVTPLISGQITGTGGAGIFDVTLTFSNGGGIAATDKNGKYLHAVPYGWSGTASPSKTGYVLEPTSRKYQQVTTSHFQQNYTATAIIPVISGRVCTGSGEGVAGVVLHFTYFSRALPLEKTAPLEPPLSAKLFIKSEAGTTAITDADGYYQLPVDYGWSGTVTPVLQGFHFSPSYHTYSSITADLQGQDFTCTPDVVLVLQVSRENERARLVQREYGKITLTVDNSGATPVAKYVIYRKTAQENYQVITEFPSSGQAEETFTHNDTYLEKNITYTYKAEALGPDDDIIGTSDEFSI